MAIKQITPMQEINGYIEAQVKRHTDALLRSLRYVGERCINAARESQGYKNRTGNLRSSVGYVLAVDGKIVEQSAFEIVKDGKQGAKDGSRYAKEVVRKFPEGVALVVVAGMDYAAYVSATGRDVLDSAELLADRLVPQMLKKLGFRK